MPHFTWEHSLIIGRSLRKSLPCRRVNRIRAVFVRYDGDHTRHRIRFRNIDRLDPRMSIGAAQHFEIAGVRRNLVLDIRLLAANQEFRIDLFSVFPDMAQIRSKIFKLR